ncbi:MAG TPA: hypothetical protein VFI38_09265 [Candidatus Acidoferrum sp.]|nr:hypothetical protein [Candidatus Acidoferrum sp.]
MEKKRSRRRLVFALLSCSLSLVIAEAGQPHLTLIVTGHAGELPVIEMGEHSYVEIHALAELVNASLIFNGNQMVLTLPAPSERIGATTSSGSQPAPTEFSKDFIRAAIEEMSIIREWRSALTNAVQRGYPITEEWISSFRSEARKSLRLVQVAATTESDRSAFQLLTNVFNTMNKVSDRFLEANRTRTYISPDALNNDPLDQSILTCAHSLAAMAANGHFMDDGSCH